MSTITLTSQTTPSVPSTNKGKIFYSSTLNSLAFQDAVGNVAKLANMSSQDYRLVQITEIYQGTTSFTPATGVRALYIECIGAGGAGGGAATSSATCSCGAGGGGGAYSVTWSTTNVSGTHTVSVGAGGTAGVAGAAGNAGGDTDFKDTAGTSICTAKGGSGGTVLAAAATLLTLKGVAGGTSSAGVGDIKLDGRPSSYAIRLSGSVASGSNGGDSPLGGGGGLGANATLSVGGAGLTYGAGGGGSMTATTAQVGGVGFNGLIRVWEFA